LAGVDLDLRGAVRGPGILALGFLRARGERSTRSGGGNVDAGPRAARQIRTDRVVWLVLIIGQPGWRALAGRLLMDRSFGSVAAAQGQKAMIFTVFAAAV